MWILWSDARLRKTDSSLESMNPRDHESLVGQNKARDRNWTKPLVVEAAQIMPDGLSIIEEH